MPNWTTLDKYKYGNRIKTVADKTYNPLKGYGFNIDTFNKVGEVVGDPAEAIRFFVEDPNLLVTLNVPDEEIRLRTH